MAETKLYHDLAERTQGSFLLGVVGPVRTGKSTFIQRFMETMVIPHIEDPYSRERARDELPQSASGRTIMTAEPKFVPEEAVEIAFPDDTQLSVRLIDCVGYMVEGAEGQFEAEGERMVTTPWFDHEVSISEAAEAGTEKVIRDHSSIGIVMTTDGSFGEIPRENFREAEERVIRELQELGKPFAVILNSARPDSPEAKAIADGISQRCGVNCLCLNCLSLGEAEIRTILGTVLEEFPLKSLRIYLPEWIDALPDRNELKTELITKLKDKVGSVRHMKDLRLLTEELRDGTTISEARCQDKTLGDGSASIKVELPRTLYYTALSRETGLPIENDADMISILSSMAGVREEYDRIREALQAVRETGYGIVYPEAAQMQLEEPKIVRQNGKYSVHLRANAPAIHMLMTNVETEVSPVISGDGASEEIISFLLQGFDGDVNRIWQSNIFGRSLDELAEEGLRSKLEDLPEQTRVKLRDTLQRMVNEGCRSMICLLL